MVAPRLSPQCNRRIRHVIISPPSKRRATRRVRYSKHHHRLCRCKHQLKYLCGWLCSLADKVQYFGYPVASVWRSGWSVPEYPFIKSPKKKEPRTETLIIATITNTFTTAYHEPQKAQSILAGSRMEIFDLAAVTIPLGLCSATASPKKSGSQYLYRLMYQSCCWLRWLSSFKDHIAALHETSVPLS